MVDVIIVGAGPAGLSAALVLGRCRRRTLVLDHGKPRNYASHGVHGFITRDGIAPSELLRLARTELTLYDTVSFRNTEVTDARAESDGFSVTLESGEVLASRTLLLATGVTDALPDIENVASFYGVSVFHCPYCDGWESRDRPIAVYGKQHSGIGLAIELTQWSTDLVLCTDGPADLGDHHRERLNRNGIGIREEKITRLIGANGRLESVVFDDGSSIDRQVLFFHTAQNPRTELARALGCAISETGTVETGPFESTHVPGLFVVGDASRSVQMVVVAAAEGAEAAVAVNTLLLKKHTA